MGNYGMGGGGGGGYGTAIPAPFTNLPMITGGVPPTATTLPMTSGYGLPPGAMMPSPTPTAGPSLAQLYAGGGMTRPQATAGPQTMQRGGTPTGAIGGGSPIAAFLMSPQGQMLMRQLMQSRGAPVGGM
jgi:hypothetical protein